MIAAPPRFAGKAHEIGLDSVSFENLAGGMYNVSVRVVWAYFASQLCHLAKITTRNLFMHPSQEPRGC